MKKKKIKYIAVFTLALVIMMGVLVAYLKSTGTLTNLFTVGSAKVDIEEDFENNKTISPGQEVTKAPKAKNSGTIDEYIFMKVSVPQMEISVLNNIEKAPGVDPNTKEKQSIFSVDVETAEPVSHTKTAVVEESTTYSDFNYNTTADDKSGSWVFVKTETIAATATEPEYKSFIFGYNRALSPQEQTQTLFDKVSLKRFMEEELPGGESVNIKVDSMCLQADNLDGNTIANSSALTSAELGALYTVCKNKGL